MAPETRDLPILGLGLGCHPWQLQAALDAGPPLDFVEAFSTTLEFDEALRAVAGRKPFTLHGFNLSLVGAEAIPPRLLQRTREAIAELRACWVLEDLAVWRLDGKGSLSPPYWPPVLDRDLLELVAQRFAPLEEYLGRTFLCELAQPDMVLGAMTPAEFFRELVARTGCGVVLDVSHWLRWAQWAGVNPEKELLEFPLENVFELHVAGGVRRDGPHWYDEEHSAELLPETIELIERALALCPNARAVVAECHGAPTETIMRSLHALAETAAVSALRSRRDDLAHGPAAVPDVAPSESLLAPGGPKTLRRQRLVRDLLEQPSAREAFKAKEREFHPEDLTVFANVPFPEWERVGLKQLRQMRRCLPAISQFVLTHAFGDIGLAFLRMVEAAEVVSWEPTSEEVHAFFRSQRDLPDWARDSLMYAEDLHRISLGDPPLSPSEEEAEGGGYRVAYPRSVVDTLNALSLGAPLPEPRETHVLFRRVGRQLEVSEV